MAFIPVNYESGKVELVPVANSVTTTKGGPLVDDGAGNLTNAASSTAVDIPYVAARAVVTTVAGQLVEAWPTKGIRFLADCDAAPAATDVGTVADLATATTLNPDASTNDLFYIEQIDLSGGAVGTSTRVFGHFVEGTPNS